MPGLIEKLPECCPCPCRHCFFHEALGNYRDASNAYRQAVAIVEKALGSDHPTMLNILSGQAVVFEAQGKHHKA